MLNRKFFLPLFLIAGSLSAGIAIADTKSETTTAGESGTFEQLDTDGDGYISEAEFEAAGAPAMEHEQLDVDGDGRINRTEFAAFERSSTESSTEMSEKSESQTDSDY